MRSPNCAEVESHLVDAIDGRLDAAASVRFHAHLETCAGCRERAALWRALTPRLREAEPAPPDAMAIRRMQLEIERRLAEPSPPAWTATVAARTSSARRIAFASLAGVALAAALFALWLRPARWPGHRGPDAFAGIVRARGNVTVGGRAVGDPAPARVPVGAPLALDAGAELELALDRGARVQVAGPARLTFEGTAADVAIRLDDGAVQVQVSHRRPDETFAVLTRDMRVEVRGTRFAVAASARGSRLDVTEGLVAVRFTDGRSVLVPAGQSVDSAPRARDDERAPGVAPPAPPNTGPPAATPSPPGPGQSCVESLRACRVTARAARDGMRAGDAPLALRLVGEGDREARGAADRCGPTIGACRDELGYLRAEALSQAGRGADAIAAFRALDRPGAPAAMRQNALYATAQLERQRGRAGRARADFERALAAAPQGTLGEESLVGAMESAHAAGEEARARALAGRYLRSFKGGTAAEEARRLLGGAAP